MDYTAVSSSYLLVRSILFLQLHLCDRRVSTTPVQVWLHRRPSIQSPILNDSQSVDVSNTYDATNTSDTYLIHQRKSRHFSDATDKDVDLALLDDPHIVGTPTDCDVRNDSVSIAPELNTSVIPQIKKPANGLPHLAGPPPSSSHESDCCCLLLKRNRKKWCSSLTGTCDWSLFKHYLFLLYVAGMSLSSAGWSCAGLYLVAHTKQIGINNTQAVMIVSMWGIADFITRPAIGWFSDLKFIRLSYIFAVAMFIGGFATCMMVYTPSYLTMMILSLIVGLSVGVYSALYTPLLTQFIGPTRLHYAFGMCIFIQGFFNMLIPPLLGKLCISWFAKMLYSYIVYLYRFAW